MSSKIIWNSLPEKERNDYNDLWGNPSLLKDPILSIPYKVLMPKNYASIADRVLNFEVRPDDIWVISYPKCGSTWTREIVWHVLNDVNKELGKVPLKHRSPFLECQALSNEYPNEGKEVDHIMRKMTHESVEWTAKCSSPRIIKSHLPFELLPRNLLDTAKVIYVCRNPKDACVSYFHQISEVLSMLYDFKGTFDQFEQCFKDGKLEYGSYFDHLKSGWKHRNHPNVKFVWYEDMQKHPFKEVSGIARFLNHPQSEDKVNELVEHVNFSNMKERTPQRFSNFFRKGEVGDWKNHLKEEKLKEWDAWVANGLDGYNIKFKFE